MDNFEYVFKDFNILLDLDELNKLGEDGWEIALADPKIAPHVIFKRKDDYEMYKQWRNTGYLTENLNSKKIK